MVVSVCFYLLMGEIDTLSLSELLQSLVGLRKPSVNKN